MFNKNSISLIFLLLLSVLTAGLWTSCEKYNSESVGSNFYPANSLVRLFTHPVYVEFSQEGARVWGPYTDEVDFSVDGTHVSLKNGSDSLALFVYGFPAAADSTDTTDGGLVIESDRNYALYINKLILRSQQQPTLSTKGRGTCYMVLPKNTKNYVYAVSAPSAFDFSGNLVITGEGELTVTNDAALHRPNGEPLATAPVALEARGGLLCQYDIKLTFSCPDGDAVRVSNGPMRSSSGTWKFVSGQNALSNLSDSIVLIAGTYSGVAHEGKFIQNRIGAVIRQASVQGLSGQSSDLLDTLQLHQHYDSTLVTLQQHFDTVTVMADSTLAIARQHTTNSIATFTPHFQMKAPWVLLSHNSLLPNDTLIVVKK